MRVSASSATGKLGGYIGPFCRHWLARIALGTVGYLSPSGLFGSMRDLYPYLPHGDYKGCARAASGREASLRREFRVQDDS